MCGIFGHIGTDNSFQKCLDGLRLLEYRGYDSAGIAGIEEGNLICYKEKGKLSELEKSLEQKIHAFQSSIAHTRWATHGMASKGNAHPHLDQNKDIAIVHNGILENYRSLRLMLEEKGVQFESETDSEVIAQLIAHFYTGDLVEAVRKAHHLMKGFWGLAILHKNHPGQIVATRCENPIVIGISKEKQEAFISSDPYAFNRDDLDLYFLENDQIALIEKDHIEIFNLEGISLEIEFLKLDLPDIEVSKGEYAHFMLKEIFEQPSTIQSAIHNRFLMERGDVEFEDFVFSKEDFEKLDKILILACGTSWHAGCIAAQQIQEFSGISAYAEIASEYRYRKTKVDEKTLVIALSQSGETFDTIAAMRKCQKEGAKVLTICNVPQSTLMRDADYTILLRAGREVSVCSTKAFTSQLAILSLLALKFGKFSGMSTEESVAFLEEITHLPAIIETVLEQMGKIELLAKEIAGKENFFFLGRQYLYPTSMESALKLKEISYRNATAYPAGELKHGPIALIDPETVVIGLMGNETTYEKMLSNLAEVKARGGFVIAFAPHDAAEISSVADRVLYLPKVSDPLSVFPYAVASQLLAYFVALHLGTEIDQPRNLAKSVTVE